MSVDLVGFVNLVGAYQDPWGDYTRLQYIAGFLDEFLAEKGSGFAVIRAKDFALVPLNPTNCYIGLLCLKNPQILIISGEFQLYLWIGNWTTRSKILIHGLKNFRL